MGWLGLHNWREAELEIEKISAENRHNPAVLLTEYDIYATAKDWGRAADVADIMITVIGDGAALRLSLAYAVRRKPGGSVEEARAILTKGEELFPGESMIAYNLACYECQLGNMDAARDWLDKAMARGDAKQIKALAVNDSDLEPIWAELKR